MQSSRKPPLPRGTPIQLRLRPRRPPLQSSSAANIIQTPPGSLVKTQMVKSACDLVEGGSEILRPEYRTISCELRALAKMVHHEFSGAGTVGVDDLALNANRSPLFERGRFYDEYSARRNERLKRKKKGELIADDHHHYDHLLGVRVESTKKRRDNHITSTNNTSTSIKRKVAVPSTPTTARRTIIPPPSAAAAASSSSRYLLRSSTNKENKKPPLTSSAVVGEKTGVRRARRI
ncbi:OLC1v1018417C1 [Oldenlandia corymbosa var. corymbosa]|uniref:OLC1v1018417C1 n=1 Tax=Oldenlandia corymbosa var. corymbosa TaxID=529605 RepID=A0AAV1EBJ4_OLDCO|nr:OLC1v1018417C1 [Oldenlandia corymbosa var. corymbosa]